jgi:putative ABC transport system ATP-binding protein
MDFELMHIIPEMLTNRPSVSISDIWGKAVQFKQGSFIKITAPSGTGKSTLIHLLYGLRKDFQGNILFNQVNISTLNSFDLSQYRRLHWSIIFQDLRLFPELTAKENIELKRILQPPIISEERLLDMAEQLGVVPILNQQIKYCSYGEQQRIAIIRALMQPFNFLLMDEPFSHLDNANKLKAAKLITEECVNRGAGIILTDLDQDMHFNYQVNLNL